MKTNMYLLVCLLMMQFFNKVIAQDGPLEVKTTSDWKLEYKNENKLHFYTLKYQPSGVSMMSFSPSPVLDAIDQIKPHLKLIAKSMIEKSNRKDMQDINIHEVTNNNCHLEYFELDVNSGFTQVVFAFSVENRVWQGMFSGSKDRWTECIEIIKSIKAK